MLEYGYVVAGWVLGTASVLGWQAWRPLWWMRGVNAETYRKLCSRCGKTGQVHMTDEGCWRFKG